MDRELLGSTEHFGTKFEIFKAKRSCDQEFQNKPFSDVCDPTGYSVPSGPWNYICAIVLNRTRRAKRSRREDKCRKLNEQHYSSFQARKNKLLSRSVICKIKYIYTFMFVESDFSYKVLPISRLS